MRWLTLNQSNPREANIRRQMLKKIDAWWIEFERQSDQIYRLFKREVEWDLAGWMIDNLAGIAPDLMWEFGPAVNTQGHRLVITPESRRELRPLTDEIIARAPSLPGWEFYAWRCADPLHRLGPIVEGRTGLDCSDVTVALSIGEHHRIDLLFAWDEQPADRKQALYAAFVIAEALLGEEVLDKWIGAIHPIEKRSREAEGKRLIPLGNLKATVDAVISSIIEQLPASPFVRITETSQKDDEQKWSVLKLNPKPADDYAQRRDQLTGCTIFPAMSLAALSGVPFASCRFGRQGEVFCCIKIDGSGNLSSMTFADRDEVERVAARALQAKAAGGLIGGGAGLKYSYIELALTNFADGIAAIRTAMQEGKVPKRSWILFHDADLIDEWVGIYDDSPAPPA